MSPLFVYVTTPRVDVAKSLAHSLLEQGLVACANIFPAVQSLYHWEGKLVEEQESVCVFKTTQQCFPALKTAIEKVHPYEVPCIVALPISDGNEPFLQWINQQVTART